MNYWAVAMGGAIGALLRYGISVLMNASLGYSSYWATLTVNALGCILMGIFWVLIERYSVNDSLRLFVSVGLLGSMTTFSTFSADIIGLLQQNQLLTALCYALGSIILGVTLMLTTIYLGKTFLLGN